MKAGERRVLVWAIVGVVLVALIVFAIQPRRVAVDLAQVSRGPVQITVSDEGRTRIREIFSVSAPVNGRLLRVETHAGDDVVGGQTVVAQIEPVDPSFLDVRSRAQADAAIKAAQAALGLAAAELKRARAELQFATADLSRKTALARTGVVSKVEIDRARLEFQTAEAVVATADAAYHIKEHELETAKALLIEPSEREISDSAIPLLAPASGRILRVLVESEAPLQAGTAILEIGDPASLEIDVELLTTDAVAVRPGVLAMITGWGGGEALHAKVRLVEPFGFTKVSALGIEEQRVRTLLDLTDPPQKWSTLGHGFRVDVAIVTNDLPDALRVPLGALFRSDSSWAVFRAEGGRARLTKIEIGPSNGTFAVVTKGLRAGDPVVLFPSDRVSDGTRISSRKS